MKTSFATLSFLAAIFVGSLASSLVQAREMKCPEVSEIRAFYKEGKKREAFDGAYCRRTKFPKDPETRALVSDMLWWDGETFESEREGKKILAMDPDSAIAFPLNDRLAHWRIRGAYTLLESNNVTGNEGMLEVDYRLESKDHISLAGYRNARVYGASTKVSDSRFEAGTVIVTPSPFYLEGKFSYSLDPVIVAKWGVSATPHWSFADGTDLAAGIKHNHYQDAPAVQTYSLGAARPFGEEFTVGVSGYSIHTEHWIFSSAAFIQYAPTLRLRGRVTYANGKTVEGPGLEGNFSSVTAEISYRLNKTLRLTPFASRYRGSARSEDDYGLGFEISR